MEINNTVLSKEEIMDKANTLLHRMIYEQPEFNAGIEQRKRDLEKLKQEKDRELWTPMLAYLQALVPEKWKLFTEQNFDFSYDGGGDKLLLCKMMKKRLWEFIGMYVITVTKEGAQKAGFRDLQDFVESIPELNTAWKGLFGIGTVTQYDGKRDTWNYTVYGSTNEVRTQRNKEFWDFVHQNR